jgi:hypothetical protein
MSLIAPAYLDRMFSERDEASLTLLSSVICGAQAFDRGHATYGLPSSLFLFVEGLLWFAQSWRSGSWTYFEATPLERQQAMLEELRTHAPKGWADQYAFGMRHWQDTERLSALDTWLEGRDKANSEFLWDHLAQYRAILEETLG